MTGSLRVLVIDDEEISRTSLMSELEEEGAGDGYDWEVLGQGFEDVEAALVRHRPDLVVLDLIEGAISAGSAKGNRAFGRIRDKWFCPVVVYTGFAHERDFEDHPLVTLVNKRSQSDRRVLAELRRFAPVAGMIQSVHKDFDARIREALHDSVSAMRDQLADPDPDRPDSALSRAVRRQVAARVDLAASRRARLLPWERLIVPPLGDHLLTADLLARRYADWTDATAFRLVLTPSCDLVSEGSRTPHADRVLVARCEPLKKLGKVELKARAPLSKGQKASLRPVLTQGMLGQHIVVPEFRGHVPLMVANLKRLELIGLNEVQLEQDAPEDEIGGTGYVRVASTDSPFREMVVWAYLGVTGRPGLPETDVDRWLDDISNHLEARSAT